jgi:alcohol dehydrogenase class IV
MVPHGASVVVSAPAVFRATAQVAPERHLRAASALGVDVRGAALADAGELLANELLRLMKATAIPTNLRALGYGEADLDGLVAGSIVQQRLLQNAPCAVDAALLRHLFTESLDEGARGGCPA